MSANYKLKILYLIGLCIWFHALSFTSHIISELICCCFFHLSIDPTIWLMQMRVGCNQSFHMLFKGYTCVAHLSNPVDHLFLGCKWRFFFNSVILFHCFVWGFVSCLWFNVKQLVYQNPVHYGLVAWRWKLELCTLLCAEGIAGYLAV